MTNNKNEATVSNSKAEELVLSRTFAAPKDLVFKVFSEATHLAKWWGPKGLTMGVTHLDFREGGHFHYSMMTPEGHEMWGRFVYGEIIPPEQIIFTNSFSDKDGGITRAPFNENWPLEVYNILTLKEDNGKTILTLRGWPINASEKELKAFEDAKPMLQQGFGGTFDQLEEYLKIVTN